MFTLLKGDCEHCGQAYRYSLLNAGFSDCSYAYCDACGKLATVNYSSSFLLRMPPITVPHQAIDETWEPFLRPCDCGGHFRHNASPRCLVCMEPLSADHAAAHIDSNFVSGGRGWHWQGNWTDTYCIDIEDPAHPGVPRQVNDPFFERKTKTATEPAAKGWFGRLFKSGE